MAGRGGSSLSAAQATGWLAAYSLSIAALVLYVVTQIGAAIAGWVEFVSEQEAHGQSATVLGSDGYFWTFLEQTMQNWQSEFLALAALVALSAVLIHRNSSNSRDGPDELQQRIQDVERRVTRLSKAQRGAAS